MLFGILTLLVALTISGVAIYYSVAGLVAIFAAASIPIIIMGGALEIGKLVAAVWLHKYWSRAAWWLRIYLSVAVLVLMFITSMGIFGFLSKAHIEQTAAANEQVATLARFDAEIIREQEIIARANERIAKAEADANKEDVGIQEKLDKEQERIDSAYTRRQPSIQEQLAIISAAELTLGERVAVFEDEITSLDTEISRLNGLVTEYRSELASANVASVEAQVQPYRDQIAELDADLVKLNDQAIGYEARIAELVPDLSAIATLKEQIAVLENRISELAPDYSAVDTLQEQISAVEQQIVLVTNKLQSRERDKIKEGQAVIGVTSDGLFGGNTTRAYNAWLEAQRVRINELQGQETTLKAQAQDVIAVERERLSGLITNLQNQSSEIRNTAQSTVTAERERLTGLVTNIRGAQTESVQNRKQGLLDTIERIRNDASSSLQTQRDNIQAKINIVLNTDIPAVREQRKLAQDSITNLRNSPDLKIESAQAEIARLRELAEAEIAQSQNVIERLRAEVQIGEDVDLDTLTDNQLARIKTANDNIDLITNQKFALQSEARKLEAEVGPVKYLAEFIYEDADRTTLEDAVRWVILIIIFVFDPLAVALLISAQYIFEWRREERNGRTNKLTNRNIQNDDVEHNERDREADDEKSLSGRSDVEPTEEQVSDSNKAQEQTSTKQDTRGSVTASKKVDNKWKETGAGSMGIKDPGPMSITIKPKPDNKKVDMSAYNPYTDTRPTEQLTKEEIEAREIIWPDGYDGKLSPPKPFKDKE